MSEGRDSINESLQKRAKAHRLPTLQPARDLTMGAKRVFVPNVNAKKTKDPLPPKPDPKPEHKKQKPDRSRKREHRDHKPFHKKEYVQSYSIFAEGAATGTRDSKGGVRFSGDSVGGGSGGAKGGGKGGLRFGGPKAGGLSSVSDGLGRLSVKKEEDRGEPFISDLDGGYMQPVVYPRKDPHTPRPLPSEFFLREPDDDEYEELAVIQMVSPMPVLSTGVKEKDVPEESDFGSLPEGGLGKLQVLDTGEVRLIIGDKGATLDVLQGTPIDHLIELVRVRQTNEEEEETEDAAHDRTGEMSVLGRVDTRFVCSVNFDDVFDEMAAERDARAHDSDSDTDEPR